MPHSKQAPLLLPRSAPSAYPNPSFSMASPVSPPQPHLPTKDPSVAAAIHVLSTERAALAHLEQLYQTDPLAQENLARAVDQIVRSIMNGGKLIFSGVGKSGKIAQKLEATMNSVGVYSAFLHPTEALHGDLGMVRPVCTRPTCFPQEPRPMANDSAQNDTLLLVSFSGRTSELLHLLPHTPSSVPVIAITAHTHPSTCPLLAFHPPHMGILLPAPIHEPEESSFGVAAPTSSTTVALSLGDALAIAAARRVHSAPGRGPAEVFRSFHPGGTIGNRDRVRSAASTPLSMSTSTSSLDSESEDHDFQTARPALSSPSFSSDNSQSLIDAIPPVPLDQIPSVSASEPRFLDVLLTAIQHPSAKSWVFLSPDELVPPQRIRALAQSDKVDMRVAELGGLAVHRRDWVGVGAGWSLAEARRAASEAGLQFGTGVVAVVDDSGGCLGVLEVEELCDCGQGDG
jgi:D-arabinose 5-phosphate isomerase GutQ